MLEKGKYFIVPRLFENEIEREQGSNLRRQDQASRTAQVLVAQTTQPIRKNRRRDQPYVTSVSILLFLSRTSMLISSRCLFSCHSLLCPVPVNSSWLPLPLFFLSLLSPSSQPPNRPCQSVRSPKACHEADSFEPAEWSERLTPGQSGWQGAAAVGSIHARSRSSSFRK